MRRPLDWVIGLFDPLTLENDPCVIRKITMKRYKYDYYDVSVPGDCADSLEELGRVAIADAVDRTRLYCLTASWTAVWVVGDVGDLVVRFRVCRRRPFPSDANGLRLRHGCRL